MTQEGKRKRLSFVYLSDILASLTYCGRGEDGVDCKSGSDLCENESEGVKKVKHGQAWIGRKC